MTITKIEMDYRNIDSPLPKWIDDKADDLKCQVSVICKEAPIGIVVGDTNASYVTVYELLDLGGEADRTAACEDCAIWLAEVAGVEKSVQW